MVLNCGVWLDSVLLQINHLCVELRCVVKFCVALNKSKTETLRMIKSIEKYDKCSPVLFINGTDILGAEENQLRTISGAANQQS